MASIGLHRAGSCIIESKLFTPTKVSKEWVKTRNFLEKPRHIYLFISSWTMNFIFGVLLYWQIIACLCFSGVCCRSMTITVPYFPGKIFLKRKLLFFLKKISERLWVRKVKTTVNTMFIENMWIEPGRRPLHERPRSCRCVARNSWQPVRAGLSRSPLLSHQVALNEGSTPCALYCGR